MAMAYHSLWTWMFCTSVIVQVVCQQEFLRHPAYTEVNPGQSAHLDCAISNKKGKCGWQKDRKPQGLIGTGKYAWNGDQERGDCGLLILNATLDLDDGIWECQVTASSLEAKDALSSREARLLVRVPPVEPVIEYANQPIYSDQNVTVIANRNSTVECVSRHGNPAASLRWYLGSEDVTSYSDQTNSTEPEHPKLFKAISRLRMTFFKEHNGLTLKCVAYHEAYERKTVAIEVPLNVQYLPVVILESVPKEDVEDGKDIVKLDCKLDANPPAFIMWRKDGRELAVEQNIELKPIRKEDAGVYSCEGRNALGSSEPATIHLDVKFSPRNVRVLPGTTQAKVHNQTSLMCMADGNPPPRFIWLFSATGDPSFAQIKGVDATLNIDNVTYDAQGTYVCMATNTVKGEERTAQSDEVSINVFGVPQIQPNALNHKLLQVERGEDAVLEVPFCSDPPPTVITWEWEDTRLAVGEGKGKFIAEQVANTVQPSDCYDARLVVQSASSSDARHYLLTVENDRGKDSFVMSLKISEPVSMSAVIGIVIGCLIVLVIVVLFVLYAFRAEKWCFKKGDHFKSNNADRDSRRCRPVLTARQGAIPPDALYTLPPKRMLDDDIVQADHNENKNSSRELDYTEVEVPKMDSRASNATHPINHGGDFRPKPHEIADI